jgi:hypothetical protein
MAKPKPQRQLKRKKPFVLTASETKIGSFLGCMAGTAKVPADMDQPVGIEWKAMK